MRSGHRHLATTRGLGTHRFYECHAQGMLHHGKRFCWAHSYYHGLQEIQSPFGTLRVIPDGLLGSEMRKIIESVGITTQAEVHVEETILIISVTNQSMRERSRLGSKENRTPGREFLGQHALPFCPAKEVAVIELHPLVITKPRGKGDGLIDTSGCTCLKSVTHLYCHPTVAHQPACLKQAHIRGVHRAFIHVTHQVPLIFMSKISRKRLSTAQAVQITMHARPYHRPMPITHHLRHGQRHTTHNAMLSLHHRSTDVIRLGLIPVVGQQGIHR